MQPIIWRVSRDQGSGSRFRYVLAIFVFLSVFRGIRKLFLKLALVKIV